MSKFQQSEDNDNAKAIAIPWVFFENSWAKIEKKSLSPFSSNMKWELDNVFSRWYQSSLQQK